MDSGAVPMIADNAGYFGLTKLHLWPMLFVIVACGAISRIPLPGRQRNDFEAAVP